MTQIKLYFTTLLFFLSFTGKISYGIDEPSKASSFFQLASNNFDFDGDGTYNVWEIDHNKNLKEVTKD
jgi:type IV pilus assembly protein PilE